VNTLERALTVALQEPILFPYHLPPHIRSHAARASLGKAGATGSPGLPEESADAAQSLPSMRVFREAMDRQYLRNLLVSTSGDVGKACAVSGLSRSSLYGLVKKHGLPLAG
jgi:two-component system NtrC family response regulator